MADTPNHGYNVPGEGEQDWHQPLNENFEAFDTDVEIRDQAGNRGSYTPADGAKFLATDTGVVSVGDGSDWNPAFVHPEYDATADEAQFSHTVTAPGVVIDSLAGALTGGESLTDVAGDNLTISNGRLDASTGSNDDDWQENGGLLEPSDSSIDGIAVDELHAALLVAGSGPLSVTVDGSQVLELTGESNGDAGNVVAGHSSNGVDAGVVGATISGGGFDGGTAGAPNEVAGDYGTVGGGRRNDANGDDATVAGGRDNDVTAARATVGGGYLNEASDAEATVGGGYQNEASGWRATVGGGDENEASGEAATVGGGRDNRAMAEAATIAGGAPTTFPDTHNAVYDGYGTVSGGGDNQAGSDDGDPTTATFATVGGGDGNTASATGATVAGGGGNLADGDHATVPGGEFNRATGDYAIACGGEDNEATGDYAFAAGQQARAHNDGAFVLSDSSDNTLQSLNPDEFVARASGGYFLFSNANGSTGVTLASGSGSWQSASSRALKSNVDPVEGRDVLDGVEDLDISTWNYDAEGETVRHMGPMAEEFHGVFGLGDDPERISTVDADGVALAAIQGLSERLDETRTELDETRAALEEKDDRIADLEAENENLRDRLSALEARVEELAAPIDD